MAQITFKQIREKHIKEVLEIYTYYILNTTVTFHIDPISVQEMKEIVHLNHPTFKTFVIYFEDTLCGYVLFSQFKKREAYSTTAEVTIYLNNEFTGKGIGSTALGFIENEAKHAGIHALIAIITGENIASIKLFKKNGYFKCAEYKEVGKKFGRYLDVIDYEKILE